MFFWRYGLWLVVAGVITATVIMHTVSPPSIIQNSLPSGTVCLEGRHDSEIGTADVLVKRFDAIVFGKDVRPETGQDLVHKWGYQIVVNADEFSEGYKAYLALVLNQLACLTGFNIRIFEPRVTPPPNIYLRSVTSKRFKQIETENKFLESARKNEGRISKCFSVGYTAFSKQRITEITTYFDRGMPETDTKNCMISKLTQALGAFGILDMHEQSVFRFKAPHVDYLTLNDKIILRTLYDPRIEPGMKREDAMNIAAEIIPELVAAVKARGVEALYQQ